MIKIQPPSPSTSVVDATDDTISPVPADDGSASRPGGELPRYQCGRDENRRHLILSGGRNRGSFVAAAGHSGSFVSLGETLIAKRTSPLEAKVYREFGEALEGVIPRHCPLSELPETGLAPERKEAMERLISSKPDKEVIVLEKLGGNIKTAEKRELDIKIGKSTASYTELLDQGHPNAWLKKARLTLADHVRGSRAMVGDSRGFCLSGYNFHGKAQGHGRNELGHQTISYLAKALDLPPDQRAANLVRIQAGLELIREKLAQVPVTFVASSVFIAIDEHNPENTGVRLIDLSHPVRKDDAGSRADYEKLNRQFDRGLANLIEECRRLQERSG